MPTADGARRRSAPSRSTSPATARRVFHKYAHADVELHREIVDAVYANVKNTSKAVDQVAMIYATLRAAARGELPTGDDLKDELEPCRTQPTLWELKWKRKQKAVVEFRMYHAEPDEGRPDFVGLHFHAKVTSGTDAQIERAQDGAMQIAADRYECEEAVQARWGHAPDGCPRCVLNV